MQLNLQNPGKAFVQGAAQAGGFIQGAQEISAKADKRAKDEQLVKLASLRASIDQVKDPTAKANLINNTYNPAFKEVHGVSLPDIPDTLKEAPKLLMQLADIATDVKRGKMTKEAGQAAAGVIQQKMIQGGMKGALDLSKEQKAQNATDKIRDILFKIQKLGKDGDPAEKERLSKEMLQAKSEMGTGAEEKVAKILKNFSEEQGLTGSENPDKATNFQRSAAIEYARQLSLGTPEGDEFAQNMQDYQNDDQFKRGFDRAAGTAAGKQKLEFEQEIIAAHESVRVIEEGLKRLDSPDGIFSGPAAKLKVGFNKFLQEFGVDLAGEKVSNTEEFAAIMARDVLGILGSGDLGVGTGISDEDRKFAARIVAGDISLDEESIRGIMDVNLRVNNAHIIMANRKMTALRKQREAGDPFAGTDEIGKPIDVKISKEDEAAADSILKGLD